MTAKLLLQKNTLKIEEIGAKDTISLEIHGG